jgi:hypothetical protein
VAAAAITSVGGSNFAGDFSRNWAQLGANLSGCALIEHGVATPGGPWEGRRRRELYSLSQLEIFGKRERSRTPA